MANRQAVLALVLAGCAHAHASAGLQAPDARIDRIFARYDRPDSPGCAVAVAQNGQLTYARAYGSANLEYGVPLSPDSVFHVASLSKQFTAFSILLLADRGKLSLDDDVRKYVPEVPDFGKRITLRHLLNHTSGLRDQWDLLLLAGWRYPEDIVTDDDVLQLLARQKELNFEPGSEFLYSNTGYTLLGVVVRRVSGKSLRDFAAENIFGPLGMTRTEFRDDHDRIIQGHAFAYAPAPGGLWRTFITGMDTVGATDLYTTVLDLVKWERNFIEHRVGSEALLRELVTPGRLNDGTELHYAAGLALGEYRGIKMVGHGGNDAGYRAAIMRFPERRLMVTCLCGVEDSDPDAYVRQVADLYLGDRPPPVGRSLHDLVRAKTSGDTFEPPAIGPAQLREYVGEYWSDELLAGMTIAYEGGVLVAKLRKGTPEPLEPAAIDEFRTKGSARLKFVRDEKGRVKEMLLTTGRVRRLRYVRSGR